MRSAKKFDVVVVGSGVTGFSTVFHLLQFGVGTVALAGPDPTFPSASRTSAGFVSGGQFDNFTRVSNAHGVGLAKDLWTFGDLAFDGLATWCQNCNIFFHRGRRLRLIISDHELRESEKAVSLLDHCGFQSRLVEPQQLEKYGNALLPKVLAVQDDGSRAAWVDIAGIFAGLSRHIETASRLSMVRHIRSDPSGRLSIELVDGSKILTEIVVLANHLAIGDFLPSLREAIVSVADQWSEFALSAMPEEHWSKPGIVFSMNHGLEWGVTLPNQCIALGGARYLRPLAGIEARVAPLSDEITKHLREKFSNVLNFCHNANVTKGQASLDCRPCDELPIIGPMFGEGRMLVATGFMGQGINQGFLAGRCIAELIMSGDSQSLPRMLWPERLRSLHR